MCPDCSPPRARPFGVEGGQHVAVADRGLAHLDAPLGHGQAEPEVGHHRDHHRVAGQLAPGRPGRRRTGPAARRRRPPPRCGRRPPAGRRRRRRPGRGRPRSRTTAAANASGWVEPQPSLMLVPSGLARRCAVTSAPSAANTPGATLEAAPLAQSSTTRRPSSRRPSSDGPPGGSGRRRPPPASRDDASRPRGRWARPRPVDPGSGRARPRSAASTSTVELGAAGAEQLDAVVVEGVVGGRDHRRRQPRALGAGRPPRRWAARPGRPRRPPRTARPADSAACSSGPERRVSRPTRKAGAGSTRAAARPRPSASSAVSSALATPRTPSVPKRARRHPATAWSTAAPCGPSSGRTSCSPSRGRRG